MKTVLRILMFLVVALTVYMIITTQHEPDKIQDEDINQVQETTEEFEHFIGLSIEEVTSMMGKPSRIDPSFYDYDWWVYHQSDDKYMQIGVQEGVVVTQYIIGKEISIQPFTIGQPVSELYQFVTISPTISVEIDGNYYRFEMSEEDLNIRPIVEWNGVFVQLYIDHFTNTLSSIRIMNAETLVKHRPYEVVYRGDLLHPEEKSDDELVKIQQTQARQIFDVSNIIRKRFNQNPLQWNDEVAKVAYEHSKDMEVNRFFAHDSPTTGTVGNRLSNAAVSYQMAGENIAAQYIDGLAAVEGWLNSEGHRKVLLEEDFTHLGVGVYRKYYTQNFITILNP
ncbi:CAP domain-containing protein [Bacillus kexueae]|uniref:CAP domain-containing protein n=1 Tax=Aeribacillus kexueae TaxID=2078952 RepID=UPI001FAF283D|nr:CAP domain-containing protein [Bacillus kexueae]